MAFDCLLRRFTVPVHYTRSSLFHTRWLTVCPIADCSPRYGRCTLLFSTAPHRAAPHRTTPCLRTVPLHYKSCGIQEELMVQRYSAVSYSAVFETAQDGVPRLSLTRCFPGLQIQSSRDPSPEKPPQLPRMVGRGTDSSLTPHRWSPSDFPWLYLSIYCCT